MDLYREEIIDHYKNPRNFGTIEKPDFSILEVNTLCGDTIEVFLKVKNNLIVEVKFRSLGCAISTASASMVTEKIKGKSLNYIRKMKDEEIILMMGGEISPVRRKCALLPLMAIKKAIEGKK